MRSNVTRGRRYLTPVGIDPGAGRGRADQGADGVAGQEAAPDLPLDHLQRLRAEHFPGAAQERLELGVPALNGVRRHPGREHVQGDPASQTPASHHPGLRHNPRSCRNTPHRHAGTDQDQIKLSDIGAGHGVAVPLKIYAYCIDGQADAANLRITEALAALVTLQSASLALGNAKPEVTRTQKEKVTPMTRAKSITSIAAETVWALGTNMLAGLPLLT
jgi:hypothetical protein